MSITLPAMVELIPMTPYKACYFSKNEKCRPLTVESLLKTNFSSESLFFAYLSACGTGQIPDGSSIDENIHIANAFHLAGLRHVVGTLQSVE